MARTIRLTILTVAILALGGCAGAPSAPGSAGPPGGSLVAGTPTLAVTPTAGVSPSPDVASLAATYTQIAAGGSAALAQCNREKAAANGTLTEAKAIAQACRNGYLAYIADLKAVNWGLVQPQADNLIAAADASDAIILEMVNATDGRSFRAAYAQLPAATTDLLASVDALRAVLGLPPAQ